MKYLIWIVVCVIGVMPYGLPAQGNRSWLEDYFKGVEKAKVENVSPERLKKLVEDEQSIVLLKVYTGSKQEKVRTEAYRLLNRLGKQPGGDLVRRQQVVGQLLEGCVDSIGSIGNSCVQYLRGYERSAFDSIASETHLIKALEMGKASKPEIYRLMGFLCLQQKLEELRGTEPSGTAAYESYSLALARVGNAKKVASLMKNIRLKPVNDAFTDDLVPLLVYVRQKESFDYLLELIQSDKKDCRPAGDSPGKILCGYRIIEAVADYIVDFPITSKALDDVTTNKAYEKVMDEVRDWIKKNKDSYKLNKEKY